MGGGGANTGSNIAAISVPESQKPGSLHIFLIGPWLKMKVAWLGLAKHGGSTMGDWPLCCHFLASRIAKGRGSGHSLFLFVTDWARNVSFSLELAVGVCNVF